MSWVKVVEDEWKTSFPEYGIFLLWKKNDFVSQEIKKRFKDQIVMEKIITLKDDRHAALCSIYDDPDFETDSRTTNASDITIYVIKDENPIYMVVKRGRTTEPRNMNFFLFKRELSEKVPRRPEWFHVTDNPFEAFHIMKTFPQHIDTQIYHSYYTFIDIRNLTIAVWQSWPHRREPPFNYTFKKLEDTPQYKYINGNKQPYIDFAIHADPRNVGDFDNLIENFDYDNYNDETEGNGRLICVSFTRNNGIVLIDGCHRASLLLLHKKYYAKVYIRDIHYPVYDT